jgi:hypothetical protein
MELYSPAEVCVAYRCSVENKPLVSIGKHVDLIIILLNSTDIVGKKTLLKIVPHSFYPYIVFHENIPKVVVEWFIQGEYNSFDNNQIEKPFLKLSVGS